MEAVCVATGVLDATPVEEEGFRFLHRALTEDRLTVG